MLGPDGDNIGADDAYRFRLSPQENSLVKLNTGAAG